MPTSNRYLAAMINLFKAIPPADLAKASEELADSVDIYPGYDPNFQRSVGSIPSDKENPRGISLPSSGRGAEIAHAEYSDLVKQMQAMASAYCAYADLLKSEVAARKSDRRLMLKAIAALAGKSGMFDIAKALDEAADDDDDDAEQAEGREADEKSKARLINTLKATLPHMDDKAAVQRLIDRLSKSAPVRENGPDWMAIGGAASRTPEPSYDDVERAAMAGHLARKSVADVVNSMQQHVYGLSRSTGTSGLVSPPVMAAVRKAGLTDADFEASIAHLTNVEHAEALTLRSRLMAVGSVPGLTVEKAKHGISARVISACYPGLA